MAYDAKAVEIIIASPSDVFAERQIVREVVADWNAIHSRDRSVVLMPVGWETHSSPDLAGRPQQIINDRLLKHADILVGIFWTRVGSPTGKAISGSVEEIEEHLKVGKPAMLYFSSAPVHPDSIDSEQYQQLKGFKAWALEHGLVESFDDKADFQRKFSRQLPITLRNNSFLKELLGTATGVAPAELPLHENLSGEALGLIVAAATEGADGIIMVLPHLGGILVQSGKQHICDTNDPRENARWAEAIEELVGHGLIEPINPEQSMFRVRSAGFNFADQRKAFEAGAVADKILQNRWFS